jgi:MoaA/NifB/PqqE/SkfB family radical SAM enzyme
MFIYEKIKTLHLEITNKCNAGCPQCGRFASPDENQSLHPELILTELRLSDIKSIDEEFIRQLDKMYACGVFGDPAAAKDCLKIFQYFREINPDIILGMNTNGSLKSKKFWSDMGRIFNNLKDSVVFSIDGLEDTNHIYRRNTDFKKIIQNAAAFIESGGQAHWDMLVFEHNQHQVEEAKQLAMDMGFTYFRTKVTRRFAFRPVQWLKLPSGHIDKTIKGDYISCQALKDNSVYIDAHGNLLPCCFIGSKIYEPLLNYSIKVNKIQDILEKHKFVDTVKSWTEIPKAVCANTCSVSNEKTAYTSQWKEETRLR